MIEETSYVDLRESTVCNIAAPGAGCGAILHHPRKPTHIQLWMTSSKHHMSASSGCGGNSIDEPCCIEGVKVGSFTAGELGSCQRSPTAPNCIPSIDYFF